MRIDLHTHSTASDGTDSPGELMGAAAYAGLDVVAITDHDTTAGWLPAIAGLPPGLMLVPGAEMSTISTDPDTGRRVSVHLLAYLFDPASPALVVEQRRLREERRTRLLAMAERMAADGIEIDIDELMAALPADAPAGRPHLARALVRAGKVADVNQAFAQYLGNGCGYYLPRQDTPVETAIELIADAGGVTVIAHPFARSRGATITPAVLAELTARGLTGVEVDHPDHDKLARAELRGLAGELSLIRTGSSDYHGANKTIALGAETTDSAQCEALIERATGSPIVGGL